MRRYKALVVAVVALMLCLAVFSSCSGKSKQEAYATGSFTWIRTIYIN